MVNFEKICRTCSLEGELQPIFIEDPFLIADILNQLTNIQIIKDDDYPQNICTHCLEKLKSAYYFIQQCQDVNIKLKEFINTQDTYKLEIYDETPEIKDESIGEYNEEFTSYTNYEFYIDNSDSIDNSEEDLIPDNSDKNYNMKTKNKLISCGICLKFIRENNLQRHLKTHYGEQSYVCSICDQNFLEMCSLQEHMRKHTDHRSFKCTHCEKTFKRRGSLLYHFKLKHREVIKLSTTEKLNRNDCEDNFPKIKRKRVYRNVKCSICFKSMYECNLRRHLKTHTGERPFACSICDKNFIQKVALQAHMRKHTGERPFNCYLCEKDYKQYTELKKHINVKHTEEIKPTPTGEFECNKCQEKFSSQIILASHKMLHWKSTSRIYKKYKGYRATTKSFLCNHCGKAFASNLKLQDHIALHTGEKRYKCDICEQSFRIYPTFRRHCKTHLVEKPNKCSFCEKSFVSKIELNLHESTHTGDRPFKCKICDQSFRQSTHLKYHSYTHTGEKQYTCTYCNKSFALKGNLTVHMRMHTGETPYICPICDKGFYDSSSMKRHKNKHLIVDNNEIKQSSI